MASWMVQGKKKKGTAKLFKKVVREKKKCFTLCCTQQELTKAREKGRKEKAKV